MIEDLFKNTFGAAPAATAYAPGRVNLIGEHIDYNGGTVMPTALHVGLHLALSPRSDDHIRIGSARFDAVVERDMHAARQGDWADYAAGAIIFAQEAGFLKGGADLYIDSTIPDGAGLSSSAALIVAILKAARDQVGSNQNDVDIARLARRVENEYISMPCGIMDQMAVAVATEGQAMALDTNSLNYDIITLPKTHHMAVIHSGQHRKLSDGRYAERKVECDEAKNALGTDDLCHLDAEQQARATKLPARIGHRIRHCVSEHQRVLAAADALRTNNIAAFGTLMNESHVSMRDDFEMTTPEIDALVKNAVDLGATGARLTGGGFGGCIVACVEARQLETWKAALLAHNKDARFIA